MSILLPDDNVSYEDVDLTSRDDKRSPGILERLKELASHPIFLKGEIIEGIHHLNAPTDKIRLVTSSWIDNPTKNRPHCTIKSND